MPSTKRRASRHFLMTVMGEVFLCIPINCSLAEALSIDPRIGRLLVGVPSLTTLSTVEGVVGTRKRNTRNGSGPTSKRRTGSGKTGK